MRDLVVKPAKAKNKGKIPHGTCTELSRSIRNDKKRGNDNPLSEMTIGGVETIGPCPGSMPYAAPGD